MSPHDLDPNLFADADADAESTPSAPDNAARFFSKHGLLHARLREAVISSGPIRTGPGRTLWYYERGAWMPGGDDEVRRRCRALLGERYRKNHVEGVISDLESEHPFITDVPTSDWVNCANGLLDWRTGTLHCHTPKVPSTYQLGVSWTPDATCPTVDAWLAEVAPPDAIELIWEIIGTAVYADQPFHRAVLLLGPGRNGKGTLLRLIRRLIGDQHIAAVTLQALGEDRFAVAQLFGKVANIAGDLDARSIGRTDTFKMATGGDLLTADHKYGQKFTFTNRATMLFSANELPGSADNSEGFFSRFLIVPFDRLRLAPGDEDPTFEDRLHAELPGVLVRAVVGLRRAMDRGSYSTVESVASAGAAYRERADPLLTFLEDCLVVTGEYGDKVPRVAVYSRYSEWCDENGHRPLGAQKLWPRLAAREPRLDFTRVTMGQRLVGGVRLVDAWH